MKPSNKIVVWDLGATKCAAALVEYQLATKSFFCSKKCHVKLNAVNSLYELIQWLELQLNFSMQQADAICIGAAGIFDGEMLHLDAGYPYPMPIGKLATQLQWPKFAIIHDYAPIVCGTFVCDIENTEHVKKLNSAAMNVFGRRVALGVGTGLGLKDGVLMNGEKFWLGTNEMGHIGINHPPYVEKHLIQRHLELLGFLRSTHVLKPNEPLSFEKILSGKGTVRLYQFLHPEKNIVSPEEVGEQLRAGNSNETMALFAWYLGLFVGSVQLAFMPDGGIWITGGVIQNHLEVLEHQEFWQGIEASPAYLIQRKQFPLFVLCDSDHVFRGGAYFAIHKILH